MNYSAGLEYKTHVLTVPLNWNNSATDKRTIDIFARVVTKAGNTHLPYLVYLQGGPGHEAPRPNLNPENPAWLQEALERYQVVMLDQRGTGRSSPVMLADAARDDLAEYCTHLRADSIVKDCEAMREHLGAKTWSVLGQSFGGFTLIHYLSVAAKSVKHAYFTGGLTAIDHHPDDVYTLTWAAMAERSREYYRRFPGDKAKMEKAMALSEAGELFTPNGTPITPSRLRSVGIALGSDHGHWALHWLLDHDPRSLAFAYDLQPLLAYSARNPLYAIIHESSYADGHATQWSAKRTMPAEFAEDETLLSGEHLMPEWFDTDPAFMPWKNAAMELAEHPWPKLYFADALQESNAVGAAAVYVGDVFVPYEFSMKTASYLPNVRTLITNEYEHSGLRTGSPGLVTKLFELADGSRYR